MLAADKKMIMTFVAIHKAYDSIDQDTVVNVLEEFGLDDKMKLLMKETITNTITNQIFRIISII